MQTAYDPSRTPDRPFPAVKTPPPMVPERQAGGVVVGETLMEEVERLSLKNCEESLAMCARMARLRRRLAVLSE